MWAVTGFDRENLYFEVQRTKEKKERIREYLEKHSDESGIIYCATRKNVDELTCFWKVRDFQWADITREWAMRQERAVRRIYLRSDPGDDRNQCVWNGD